MPRAKRPYVPKIKGCHECAQRRIHCDRTEPGCKKCASRNIPSSGQDGIFRFKYTNTNNFRPARDTVEKRKPPPSSPSSNIIKHNQIQGRAIFSHEVPLTFEPNCSGYESVNPLFLDDANHEEVPANAVECQLVTVEEVSATESGNHSSREVLQEFRTNPAAANACLTIETPAPTAALNAVDAYKRFLLAHFSNEIAPEMVVVDDDVNGWRYLALPIAMSDELVMNAVLAVSASHFAINVSDQNSIISGQYYDQAIKCLQRRRNLNRYHSQTMHSVLLGILILLVGVMVNGCCDFPVLFRTLRSALDAIGGEDALRGEGELTVFLRRQVQKMSIYAAPLLDPEAGLRVLSAQVERDLEDLKYYSSRYPGYSVGLSCVGNLVQQAFRIYLQRASAVSTSTTPTTMIEEFKMTLESFPHGSPGEHSTVWATYIAATASQTQEHRDFFLNYFLKQQQRNGFRNIVRAIGHLRQIWERGD